MAFVSVLMIAAQALPAATAPKTPPRPKHSPLPRRDERLDEMMADIVKDLTSEYSRKHRPEHVAAAVIDMGYVDKPCEPLMGAWRGDEPMYPASIVKTYYMGAAFAWAREGKFDLTPSIMTEIKYMIGVSSNPATVQVLNKLCGTAGGDRLSAKEFKEFAEKRDAVNRWLRGLGLEHTNADQGTWDGAPTPRDLQLMTGDLSGKGATTHHNRTTAIDMADFLYLIATDQIGAKDDCDTMRALMKRDSKDRRRDGYRKIFQDTLPDGTTIWGKSGYTSETSHDTAIITTAGGRRFVLVTMTEVTWDTTGFLGEFAAETLKRLSKIKPRPAPSGEPKPKESLKLAEGSPAAPGGQPAASRPAAPGRGKEAQQPVAQAAQGEEEDFWSSLMNVLKFRWLPGVSSLSIEDLKTAAGAPASSPTLAAGS
ncbi:MAG: serine hydrolase [Candidatus Sumerlaeota bacterium]|nr:serine hydrolase [Candidatus Sumerlaeota bacterium]